MEIQGPRLRGDMRLRTLLALLFTVLLTLTAGTIGWLGYSSSHRAVKQRTQEEIALANASATHHVIDFLDDPANRLLSEMTLRARRGMLKLNDDRGLGFDLAERLRVNPSLAWISYSDAATGHFIGVWRNDAGQIVLNISSPGITEASEDVVQPDGATAPYHRDKPEDYDPRRFDWYKNAVAAQATVWSPPYLFTDGVQGITASRAWRVRDGGPAMGVFTVDFYLKDLEGLLDELKNVDGFSAILAPDGQLICASKDDHAAMLAAAVTKWMKANPNFKDVSGSHLISIDVGGEEYLAALQHVDAPSGLKCVVAGMVPRALVFRNINNATRHMLEVVLAALVIALLAGGIVAYRISAPLHALGDDMDAVGRFQLAGNSKPRSVVREVNQLHAAADRMKSGLRSFIKYVPDDLVRQLLASGKEAMLGGEIRRLTVFFSDIEGFTTHSERTAPDVLVHELADYFQILSRQLRQHSGTIDKFIGDGLLGFFNAPEDVPLHEKLACHAALMALEQLAARDHPVAEFRTRIGLHSGDVLVGNLGTPDRLSYTVLGDVVNVTSRLENLNKTYGTQILASGEVRDHAGDEFQWRHLDRVSVAGRTGGMEIYELMGLNERVDSERRCSRDQYEEALALYFTRHFREADEIFRKLADSGDKAAVVMTVRCDHFLRARLPEDWNGVFSYEFK
jgi:adenylate cyclase